MNKYTVAIVSALVAQIFSFFKLITVKDGKIGVDFLGNSATIGIAENPIGSGIGGSLVAEAKTIFGPKATAGIAGAIGSGFAIGGNMYAHAQAIQGVHAGAGLAGGITYDEINGAAFAHATAKPIFGKRK